MNPKKILLLLLSVLGILTALAYIVPEKGFSVFGYTVRYPTIEKFMAYKPVAKKDISKITNRLETKLKKLQADSSKKHKNANLDGTNIGVDTSAEAVDEEGLIKISFGKDQVDVL